MDKTFLANINSSLSLYQDNEKGKMPLWYFGEKDADDFLIPPFGGTVVSNQAERPDSEIFISPSEVASSIFSGIEGALEDKEGSFRITSGNKERYFISPKYYPSGWKGGSRADITTYDISKFGKRMGVIGKTIEAASGINEIVEAYNKGENVSKVMAKVLGGFGGSTLAGAAASYLFSLTGWGIPIAIAASIVLSGIGSEMGEKLGETIYEKATTPE